MPKVSKSSASSGTRKKHARKAAGEVPELAQPNDKAKPTKKQIKKGLAPPPKKSYISPSKLKPAPINVDPLDGLGQLLPPDLLLVLRKLAKKDAVTKARALEELEAWVRRIEAEKDEAFTEVLINMLPVWLHRYPALCVYPSRRVRLLCASIHALLLEIPSVRVGIITFVHETGSEAQISHVLGSWCLCAWDIDRGTATRGNRSWKSFVNIKETDDSSNLAAEGSILVLGEVLLARYILPFIITTVMHPSSTYATLVPSHPSTHGNSPGPSQHGTPRRGVPPHSGSVRRVLGGETPEPTSAKGDEDPEAPEDRDARLRVSALGALKWFLETITPTDTLSEFIHSALSSPAFWTILNHTARPPFLHDQTSDMDEHPVADGFGHGQTAVRRAGWGVLHALVNGQGVERLMAWTRERTDDAVDGYAHANTTQHVISCAVLRSAFTESDSVVRSSMWEPLLLFLTKFHDAWLFCDEYERAVLHPKVHGNHECDDELTHSVNDEEPTSLSATCPAYKEFLAFLSLGCNGSAVQGYPAVLVLLSTIPKEILSPDLSSLSIFFDSLWSAIDGQALSSLSTERGKEMSAFLGAWGECLVWTAGKFIKGHDAIRSLAVDGEETPPEIDDVKLVAHELVKVQFEKLVGELGGALRVEAYIVGTKVASVLDKLEVIASDLLTDALDHLSKYASVAVAESDDEARRKYAILFLVALREHSSSDAIKRALDLVVTGITEIILARCQSAAENSSGLPTINEGILGNETPPPDTLVHARILEILLDHFGAVVGQDSNFTLRLDTLLMTQLSSLLSQPSLILVYLRHADSPRKVAVWHTILSTLGSSLTFSFPKRMAILRALLDSAGEYELDDWAKPQGSELQGLAEQILDEAVTGDAASSTLMVALLRTPGPFIPAGVAQDLITSIVITLDFQIRPFIYGQFPIIKIITSSISLLLGLGDALPADHLPQLVQHETLPRLFVSAFVFQHCASLEDEEKTVIELTRRLWDAWSSRTNRATREQVTGDVKELLKSLILDTNIRASPLEILHALPQSIGRGLEAYSMMDVLPTQSEFDSLLSSTSTDPIDHTLALIEPLAPTVSSQRSRSAWNDKFDSSGFSPYARGVRALLHVLSVDRHVARMNMWTLQHVLTLALFASEVLQLPGADSPVFVGHAVAVSELREISRLAQQAAAFLSASVGDASWHTDVVASLSGKASGFGNLDSLGNLVKLVFEQSKRSNTVRDSLVLHTVLQHVLSSVDKPAADKWVDLARDLEGQALQTSLAISLAVTEFAPEPPRLDRYRNELASKLSGVPASKANSTGMRLLRCLCATAPNPESDIIFLPQQRAVFLVQALQNWLGSDEELDECVENEVTLLLFNLAPILQHVQGSHWEFILDLIESNFENSSFEDADTLVLLSRTLRLLAAVRDLASTNKYINETWNKRSKVIHVLIRDLLAIPIDHIQVAIPRSICREQALSAIEDLPRSLMDENTLSNMCHLLTEPSADNQKMAYQMLQQAAIKRTEHLVVEAGVDSDDTVVIDLPKEILLALQSNIDLDAEGNGHDSFAYLLAWMLTFDLFIDASVKVKTAYVDQMRTLDLIGLHFLPNIFEILSVGNSRDVFKLDPWLVDEYWLPMYDPDVPQSVQLLAAHIYFRALTTVPSLIRTWWEDLKDRQLSAAITTYTSTHFSPILIASELGHLKPAARYEAGEEPLADDVFNVKIALAVNEVTATFNVDDQRMEIGIKLPVGYPLRTVDVRPINRVGVAEKVWRRWLFAVQQVVTAHNGRIVDGLALFKKTVSLHFEGQAECAICYSILHVVDRSLPTNPCKTCKNRFHAGCLYKWFNTSHSSSCPLCRSDIM